MHQDYGGVVPELASRDHIRRVLPLIDDVLAKARQPVRAIAAIGYTEGPGLAGALLVGAGIAHGLAMSLACPVLGIHHLEGHLLSPLLSEDPPEFPFVALLVSGGHTQLMHVRAVGRYELLGETLDDAAGEAFDKTAQLLGLGYPGGPQIARLAQSGIAGSVTLPRPMLRSGNLDFSFSGLKTAVMTAVKRHGMAGPTEKAKADIARGFEDAIVDVLVAKSLAALQLTGLTRLVVAGGVGANSRLRGALIAALEARDARVFFPELVWCTDNGAMIAFAAALRFEAGEKGEAGAHPFGVRPRWPLSELSL
jgi:N6-L-threonylcarbamoyladenine synthase